MVILEHPLCTSRWCRWAGSDCNNQIDERLFRLCGDVMRHAYNDHDFFGVIPGSPSSLMMMMNEQWPWSNTGGPELDDGAAAMVTFSPGIVPLR
ncbi:hypothetical protein BS78_K029000 [Paspalum vaginatum]|uniref:Uncharacterized protein n=1 Tax=Paspalum vaginatum TaxID=158149 RepID=A0A9W8CG22_9POAL|nr:hypothetical protein BS78_K029000 [Paspalum vaginatum]